MSTTRLAPPPPDARDRLARLVARFGDTVRNATYDHTGPGIAAWSAAVERRYDGFGIVQRHLGNPHDVDFDALVRRHQQAGFTEVHRGSYTYVRGTGEETTPPRVLMLHTQLGILASLRGYIRQQPPTIGPCRTTWWLNAVVTDPAPFRAMGTTAGDSRELWLSPGQASPATSLYKGVTYDDQLLDGRDADLPAQRQLFVGPLEFLDAGIADRLDVLRATSVPLTPWVCPTVLPYALGPTLQYGILNDDPRSRGEGYQDSVDTTRHILDALPAHVHHTLGPIIAT